MQNNNYRPYSDDYMRYDEASGRYVLTEKALMEKCGINLRARMSETALVSPEVAIENLVTTVSDMIYQFIHAHNQNTPRQDFLIATVPELRTIIQKAMVHQAIHVLTVGNLYLSTKPEERTMAISYLAQGVLGDAVPCLGVSILYTGAI